MAIDRKRMCAEAKDAMGGFLGTEVHPLLERRRIFNLTEAAFSMTDPILNKDIKSTRALVSRFILMVGLALALCAFPPYSNATLALPLYYDFDEGSGILAVNKGNAINANGTINGAVYEPDSDRSGIGSVMGFDGNGDHISVSDSFSYFNFVTVEAWIKPDKVDGQSVIWDDYGSPGVLLAIVDGKVQFAISTAADPGVGIGVYGGTVCVGKWQHVAGTYDGATVRVFVNGVEVASATTSGAIIGNGAGIAAAIGSDNQSTNALNFAGKIDNFYLWNDRALPASFLGDGNANSGASCSIVNQPPIANAGVDQDVNHPKPLPGISLNGTGSHDPDVPPAALTYTWTQVGPKTVTLLGADTATPSFIPPSFGHYTFSLIVNDGVSDSTPDLVNISVFDSLGLNLCVTACPDGCPLTLATCEYKCQTLYASFRNSNSSRAAQRGAFDLLAFQQTYRNVYDRLLAASPEGQRFIQLFNSHSAELLKLGFANPDLVKKIVAAQRMAQPLFDALLAGKGTEAIITAEQMLAVDEILNDFVAIASPALQQDIVAERARLGSFDNYVGKTMSQAQTTVLGHGVFLPRLSNP